MFHYNPAVLIGSRPPLLNGINMQFLTPCPTNPANPQINAAPPPPYAALSNGGLLQNILNGSAPISALTLNGNGFTNNGVSTCNSSNNNNNNNNHNKDSQWLTLEVCREYQRNMCPRTEEECKYAHPPMSLEVQNGRIMCCYDSIKGNCHRIKPPCKYYHPPQHLKDVLIQNGKNNLLMKNLQMNLMHQQLSAAVLAAGGSSAAATVSPNVSATSGLSPTAPIIISNHNKGSIDGNTFSGVGSGISSISNSSNSGGNINCSSPGTIVTSTSCMDKCNYSAASNNNLILQTAQPAYTSHITTSMNRLVNAAVVDSSGGGSGISGDSTSKSITKGSDSGHISTVKCAPGYVMSDIQLSSSSSSPTASLLSSPLNCIGVTAGTGTGTDIGIGICNNVSSNGLNCNAMVTSRKRTAVSTCSGASSIINQIEEASPAKRSMLIGPTNLCGLVQYSSAAAPPPPPPPPQSIVTTTTAPCATVSAGAPTPLLLGYNPAAVAAAIAAASTNHTSAGLTTPNHPTAAGLFCPTAGLSPLPFMSSQLPQSTFHMLSQVQQQQLLNSLLGSNGRHSAEFPTFHQ